MRDNGCDSSRDIFAAIQSVGDKAGSAGELMVRWAHESLADYLVAASEAPNEDTAISSVARDLFAQCVRENWGSLVFAPSASVDPDVALRSLFKRRVLFSGPHLQLLPEHYTFSSYLTAIANAAIHNDNVAWVSPCATLRLQVERQRGPGWLDYGEGRVNLFGLSIQQMKARRVCVSASDYHLNMGDLNIAELSAISSVAAPICWNSPADFFQKANGRLLAHNWRDGDPTVVSIDERFAAKLVAKHLQRSSSPVRDLVTCDGRLLQWVSSTDRESSLFDARQFRHPTIHFWECLPEGRLRALSVDSGGSYVNVASGDHVCHGDADSLLEALDNNRLVPSLYLAYFVLGFLPRIRLGGGVRQLFYHKQFFDSWCSFMHDSDQQSRAFLDSLPLTSDDFWALTAIDSSTPTEHAFMRGTAGSMADIARDYLSRSLAETSNGFRAVVGHEYFQ